MQFRTVCFAVLLSLTIANNASAVPVVINDGFIGGTPTNAGWYGQDVIGDPDKFDIDRLEVEVIGAILHVDVYSTYFDNVGSEGTQMGDLFISTNGWHPYGAAPYNDDDASVGETWEYALVMSNHTAALGDNGDASLYQLSNGGSIIKSDDYFGGSGYIYRGNQEVQFNPLQTQAVGTGTWALTDLVGGTDKLSYSIALNDLGLITAEGLGFHWAFTCGNDVIEGRYEIATVPEPTSILLVGAGLAGALRRRRVVCE